MYIGVGNGAPWDRNHRSPEGGDNLYLSSIVALDVADGSYKWHFQTTPGDTWDYTATQPLILADMEIEGKTRKVIMQAPKNGFFYVIDRINGEFISGDAYTYQNWAKGLDDKGRPIEEDYARYADGSNIYLSPGARGGHNWQPMAYNRKTKLVYIPTHTITIGYSKYDDPKDGAGSGSGWRASFAGNLAKPTRFDPNGPSPVAPFGRLIAYDPVAQKEVWGVKQVSYWNGGLLTTATGLVFQGDAEGKFKGYDASTGAILWETDVRSGVIAPPITYMVDGKQYLTIAVGWGGSLGLGRKFTSNVHLGTIYTWEIGGRAEAPKKMDGAGSQLTLLEDNITPLAVGRGFNVYVKNCIQCHGEEAGAGGGALPDLTRSTDGVFKNHKEIILNGALVANGMPSFKDRLTEEDIAHLQSFLKYTSKAFRSGTDPLTYLSELAQMQGLANATPPKSVKD